MPERVSMILIALLFMPVATAAAPQDEETPEEPAEPADANPAAAPSEATPEGAESAEDAESQEDDANAALTDRLEALERENERQAEEIAELQEKAEEEELAELEALSEGSAEFEPTFNIYGFFDVGFFKWFFDDDNVLQGALPRYSTFAATDLNLYLHSQMTETVSFLAELRFTYLPHGVTDYDTFERRDTSIQDPHTNEEVRLGGVFIERVHMTWQPRDWFGVTAGRFITPFGIWNIDHGSPVLLGSYAPYIMLTELVPLRQTGVMAHGRFVPAETWFIDYALTLTNGRGPTDQVLDLDENKAVGLRIKTTVEKGEFRISLGGYGYYGQTTDESMSLVSTDPPEVEFEQTERFNELIGSADLLVELFGVRLQAEYARSLRRYRTRPARTLPMIGSEVPGMYQPDYVAWVGYVLLGWTLPLDALIGDMRITPWVMVERSKPEDTSVEFDLWSIRWGINFKPNSFVAIKVDAGYLTFSDSTLFPDPTYSIGTQVAVAF
jgi:hypothetical protein